MNSISAAGLSVARSVAAMYAEEPKVRAVILGGSVARGIADEYSDLEIGVFWHTTPTDEERRRMIGRLTGEEWFFN